MYIVSLFSLVNILAVYATAQTTGCPELYLRYSETHTYCKPANQTCNLMRSSVSAADKESIVKTHNTYRSKLAVGQESKLPTATNMIQMVWDDELAAVAQKHAQQCVFDHDCGNCRRVQNFGVGQNLAIEEESISPNIPNPNWPKAIKMWYDEVAYFTSKAIDPFISPPAEPTYGHFSQVVWASSWRIGCGYALYQDQNKYKRLYTCNYGPAGNTASGSMYKAGPQCSACPVNACCDKTCGPKAEYSGLCKITDNKAPRYKPAGSYIFYCDFNGQSDCNGDVTGPNKWLTYSTLSGSYLGIVLKGGEESSMTFQKKVKPNASSFCVVVNYRRGANVAGQEDANSAIETFSIGTFSHKQNLPTFKEEFKQQFSQFSMALSWNYETEIKLTFAVPAGKPDQFFEIQSIYAKDGQC